jgi:hypothetical protein
LSLLFLGQQLHQQIVPKMSFVECSRYSQRLIRSK